MCKVNVLCRLVSGGLLLKCSMVGQARRHEAGESAGRSDLKSKLEEGEAERSRELQDL